MTGDYEGLSLALLTFPPRIYSRQVETTVEKKIVLPFMSGRPFQIANVCVNH